jgi:hypothetical protein
MTEIKSQLRSAHTRTRRPFRVPPDGRRVYPRPRQVSGRGWIGTVDPAGKVMPGNQDGGVSLDATSAWPERLDDLPCPVMNLEATDAIGCEQRGARITPHR